MVGSTKLLKPVRSVSSSSATTTAAAAAVAEADSRETAAAAAAAAAAQTRPGDSDQPGVEDVDLLPDCKLLCFPWAGGSSTIYRRWYRFFERPECTRQCQVRFI